MKRSESKSSINKEKRGGRSASRMRRSESKTSVAGGGGGGDRESRVKSFFPRSLCTTNFLNRIEHVATDQNRGNVASQKIDDIARHRAMVVASGQNQKWGNAPSQKYASVPNQRRAVVNERKGEDDRHREREENAVPVAIAIRAAQRWVIFFELHLLKLFSHQADLSSSRDRGGSKMDLRDVDRKNGRRKMNRQKDLDPEQEFSALWYEKPNEKLHFAQRHHQTVGVTHTYAAYTHALRQYLLYSTRKYKYIYSSFDKKAQSSMCYDQPVQLNGT